MHHCVDVAKKRAQDAVRAITREIWKRTGLRIAISLTLLLVILLGGPISGDEMWRGVFPTLRAIILYLFVSVALAILLSLVLLVFVGCIERLRRKKITNSISPEIDEIIAFFRTRAKVRRILVFHRKNEFSACVRFPYATIYVDRNALGTALRPEEFRAIIGHEFGHIACGDLMVFRELLIMLFSLPVEITVILYRALREIFLWAAQKKKKVFEPYVAYCDRICSFASMEAICQLKEFRADAWVVAQTGDPIALRNGIRVLTESARNECMADGMTAAEIAAHEQHPFGTHPPLVRRELHLIGYLDPL